MTCVFGPVPSWRLGRSLGIDPVPLKTCNWNCVYCQLGRTTPLTDTRREFFPRPDLLAEVRDALARQSPGAVDWVTCVGSGETTLYLGLGWLIRQIKGLTDLPVAVITNGSLLYLPEVRAELATADAVLPTLDAGNAELYRQINRPLARPTFQQFLEGLVTFRQGYRGKLWLEVMLVKGLNDTEPALNEIAAAVRRIQPDRVHLNLPTRPPAEPWVQPTDGAGLMSALVLLGEIADVAHPAEGEFDLSGSAGVVEAILGIITRHPMQEEELVRAVERCKPGEATEVLHALRADSRAQVVERYGERFWSAAAAKYPMSST